MNGTFFSKQFSVLDELDREIAIVVLEHLWANVYGLKYRRKEKNPTDTQWAAAISKALVEAKKLKARQVIFRLIRDAHSDEISLLLPELNFKKKNERVEFKKPIDELPDDTGSPMCWKSAAELCWTPKEIAATLKLVAEGDPDTDPSDDAIQFIQDFLADPILTSGLSCVHIGYMGNTVAAMTVVQINPKSGWSRISYMGIAPAFRKQNLGKWVHRYSFKIMKMEGGKLYHGGTVATNTRMINLFKQHNCELFCQMEEWVYIAEGSVHE